MDNKEFGKQLESRTRSVANRIITLFASLPNSPECKVIRNQITKSGTCAGLITEKLIEQEVMLILKTKYAKVKQAKLFS